MNPNSEYIKNIHADIPHSVSSFAGCSHHPNIYAIQKASICISAVQVVTYGIPNLIKLACISIIFQQMLKFNSFVFLFLFLLKHYHYLNSSLHPLSFQFFGGRRLVLIVNKLLAVSSFLWQVIMWKTNKQNQQKKPPKKTSKHRINTKLIPNFEINWKHYLLTTVPLPSHILFFFIL